MEITQLVMNRLANEIGTLKAQLIQAQTFNEYLAEKNKQLEAQLVPKEGNPESSEAE